MKVKCIYKDETYRIEEDIEAKWGKNWKKKIFEIVVSNLIAQVEPKGLKGPQARSYNRILVQLDLAQSDTLDLETADFEFLKGIVMHENACVPPGQCCVFVELQDAIEEAIRPKVEEAK